MTRIPVSSLTAEFLLAWNAPVGFDRPVWLLGLVAVAALAIGSWRSLRSLEPRQRLRVLLLRCSVLTILLLALARIELVRRNDHVAVMFVMDRSRSIPTALREAARDYVQAAVERADRDDRFGVIGFDTDAAVDLIATRGGARTIRFGNAVAPDRTNIAAGIRMALASFPHGYARRIVLLTDGNENLGDMSTEIAAAAANRVAIDVAPLTYQHDREILLDRLSVPAHARVGTKVPVRVVIRSQRAERVRLRLRHNGSSVPLAQPVVDLDARMRPNVFTIPIEMTEGGVHRFQARIEPMNLPADAVAQNNHAEAFSFVAARGRVLILTPPGARDDDALCDALRREQIEVKCGIVGEQAIDALDLQQFSAVVLANTAADLFTRPQQQALASYVRDFGGGLVMTGGDEAFGAGGWIGTPVEEVSPVAFGIPGRLQLRAAALVLVLDGSGSMSELVQGTNQPKQAIANESAVLALGSLLPQDQVGVVAFTSQPEWLVPLQYNDAPDRLARRLRSLTPGGGTAIYPALEAAFTSLVDANVATAFRHIILLTDGHSPGGPYTALLADLADEGITLSTIGVGDEVNQELLKTLAEGSGGRYYPVEDPRRLPQVFFRETQVLRRRLIEEDPFTPRLADAFSPLLAALPSHQLPPLQGLVLTQPKPDATVPIVRAQGDSTDPVLAHWQYELGKVVVFTSGFWPRWGPDWVAWDRFGTFWAGVIRWAARQDASDDFDVMTRLDGDVGHIVVEALNKDAAYVNFLRIHGRLVNPALEHEPLVLHQTGPGRYEATFNVAATGNYLASLAYHAPTGETGVIRTGLSIPYSPEYRAMGPRLAVLDDAMTATGGRALVMSVADDDVFRRDLPPVVARRPVWRWLLMWVLLPLFVLDVAARRLASIVALSIYVELAILVAGLAAMHALAGLFWGYLGVFVLAEIVGWTMRRKSIKPLLQWMTANVTGLSRVEQRSTASLSQLKDVRENVRRQVSTPDARPRLKADGRDRKAGDRSRASEANDAVGTPGESASSAPAAKRDTNVEDTSGSLTARLKRAKERARREVDEQRHSRKDNDQT